MNADIIIVGSGIVGMSLALSLSKENKKIIIIEKNLNASKKINRVYSISEKTKFFFEDIDVWRSIKEVNNIDSMFIYYRKYSEKNLLSFTKKESNKNIGYIAQSKNIVQELMKKIEKDEKITFFDNCEVELIEDNKKNIEVLTNTDVKMTASYLFSCEGSKSSIKSSLGIKNIYDDYASQALVFNIDHEKPNKNKAYQIFLESGPVAFLPVSSNSFSMVISVKNEKYDDKNFCEDNILKFIKDITNNSFGKISLSSKINTFKLIGYDSETYKSGKVLFVGDSAHSVHPLAGMGLNLGISDIIEIRDTLQKSSYKFENQNFFSGYARKQKIVNKNARQQLKLIEILYSFENKLAGKVIRAAMSNLQGMQYIKEKIIKHANNNLSFF